VTQIGFNLSEICLDFCTVDIGTQDTGKIAPGLLGIALFNQITRRFWKEEHSAGKNRRPEELDRNNPSVSRGIRLVLFSFVGASSE